MAKQIEFGKFLIIECTAKEMNEACGSPGICDFCGKPSGNGYYIAVLNSWHCKECFDEWKKRASWYAEDAVIERRNFDYYAPLLGVKCQ